MEDLLNRNRAAGFKDYSDNPGSRISSPLRHHPYATAMAARNSNKPGTTSRGGHKTYASAARKQNSASDPSLASPAATPNNVGPGPTENPGSLNPPKKRKQGSDSPGNTESATPSPTKRAKPAPKSGNPSSQTPAGGVGAKDYTDLARPAGSAVAGGASSHADNDPAERSENDDDEPPGDEQSSSDEGEKSPPQNAKRRKGKRPEGGGDASSESGSQGDALELELDDDPDGDVMEVDAETFNGFEEGSGQDPAPTAKGPTPRKPVSDKAPESQKASGDAPKPSAEEMLAKLLEGVTLPEEIMDVDEGDAVAARFEAVVKSDAARKLKRPRRRRGNPETVKEPVVAWRTVPLVKIFTKECLTPVWSNVNDLMPKILASTDGPRVVSHLLRRSASTSVWATCLGLYGNAGKCKLAREGILWRLKEAGFNCDEVKVTWLDDTSRWYFVSGLEPGMKRLLLEPVALVFPSAPQAVLIREANIDPVRRAFSIPHAFQSDDPMYKDRNEERVESIKRFFEDSLDATIDWSNHTVVIERQPNGRVYVSHRMDFTCVLGAKALESGHWALPDKIVVEKEFELLVNPSFKCWACSGDGHVGDKCDRLRDKDIHFWADIGVTKSGPRYGTWNWHYPESPSSERLKGGADKGGKPPEKSGEALEGSRKAPDKGKSKAGAGRALNPASDKGPAPAAGPSKPSGTSKPNNASGSKGPTRPAASK